MMFRKKMKTPPCGFEGRMTWSVRISVILQVYDFAKNVMVL